MCGIAGIFNYKKNKFHECSVVSFLEALSHRGDDNSGYTYINKGNNCYSYESNYNDNFSVFLGHKRLSILDLNERSNQPMCDTSGELWITYNGEIFNYLEIKELLINEGYNFVTKSDTEVILYAYKKWGEDCVNMFDGMFAFAIWDELKKNLFIARDHIGIKPLYYYQDDLCFIFSSEALAINKLIKNFLKEEAVLEYLAFGYVPGNHSIFENIKKLEPGSYLNVNFEIKSHKTIYYSLTDFSLLNNSPDLQNLDDNLNLSINRQLRSDVRIGTFLSGGIDSSLITKLAKDKADITAFSVGYENGTNELKNATELSRILKIKHRKLLISDSMAMNAVDNSMKQLTEPICDSAMVSTLLLSELADSYNIKVILNGSGGDELFGGYTRYTNRTFKRTFINKTPYSILNIISKIYLRKYNITGLRINNFMLDNMLSAGGSIKATKILNNYSSPLKLYHYISNSRFINYAKFENDRIKQRMISDCMYYLPDQLLLLFDQLTMKFTIEGRVPLLGKNLVDTMLSINSKHHVTNNKKKILLKKVSQKYLPKEILNRKKLGFGGPQISWVNNNHAHILKNIMELPNLTKLVNGDKLKRYISNSRDHAGLFSLYCLKKWCEHHIDH